jgi:Zn finger protein HypA/HybF involved in hydrogenase expression
MAVIQAIKLELICDRCGHSWQKQRESDDLPQVCPKCKSKLWNSGKARAKGVKKAA